MPVYHTMSNMKVFDIINIIKQGEGETVEFKTSPAGIAHDICAFLNTAGGMALIGVDNQGNLVGIEGDQRQKISDLLEGIQPAPKVVINKVIIEDKEIIIIKVPKSDKLHSIGGRIYIRLAANNRPLSSEEIIEKAAESTALFYDEIPHLEASRNDINDKKVEQYLNRREMIRGVKIRGSLDDNLRLLKIMKLYRKKPVPTNGGLLFFGKDPQRYIGYSRVKLIDFQDEDMREYKDQKEFLGTIDAIVEGIEEHWAKNIAKVGGLIVGFKRHEFFEYPMSALREALVNALIHRNYADPTEVIIFVFPTRMLIKNPGSFPPGVTPQHPEHKARNPLLTQFMYDMGYMEKYGSGIMKIKEDCRNHPLVNVYFHLKAFGTEVEFKKEKELKIDETNQKILDCLRNGPKRSSELAAFAGISKQSVLTRLQDLLQIGLVLEQGRGPELRYHLKKQRD